MTLKAQSRAAAIFGRMPSPKPSTARQAPTKEAGVSQRRCSRYEGMRKGGVVCPSRPAPKPPLRPSLGHLSAESERCAGVAPEPKPGEGLQKQRPLSRAGQRIATANAGQRIATANAGRRVAAANAAGVAPEPMPGIGFRKQMPLSRAGVSPEPKPGGVSLQPMPPACRRSQSRIKIFGDNNISPEQQQIKRSPGRSPGACFAFFCNSIGSFSCSRRGP